MASGVDLGKQVGPLPLGAWVVVVGGGLGIALYTRRQNAGTVPLAEVVDNTSGDAGVGTGEVGGWQQTAPPANAGNGVAGTPTTNDEWGTMVANGLIARNYPPATVDSMVRKYVAGASSSMSPAEYALLTVALATYGAPPQILPPDGTPPTTTPPSGGTTTPPATGYVMKWVSVKSTLTQTLAQKQTGQAHVASGLGVWKPSSASLKSVIAQAAVRSACLPNSVIKPGRWVVLYMPVKK